MSELPIVSRIASLPYGYTAEFTWSPPGMAVVWEPAVPVIHQPRARRRFLAAYDAARAAFLADVATVLNGRIALIDREGMVSSIDPGTRH